MKKKNTVAIPALALCVAFIGGAISVTMLGPMVPVLQATYNVSLAQNGLMTLLQGIGGITVTVLLVIIADRIDKRVVMVIAYIVYNSMLYMAALLPPYLILLSVFFMIGAGMRVLDALVNANMSELAGERKGFFLNLLHSSFGIGALSGPILASVVLEKYDLSSSFLVIACVCTVLLAGYFILSKKGKRAWPVQKAAASKEKSVSLITLLKSKSMLILGFCTMLYNGFAVSIALWIPSYFMEMEVSSLLSASIVSFLWVGIITGRFTYSFLSLKYSMKKLITISNLIGGSAIICATIINRVEILAAGYMISGFFIGAVTPLGIAIVNKEIPSASGRISSIIIMFAAIGTMAVPATIGVIAQNVSFYSAVFVLNLSPMLIALLSSFLFLSKKTLNMLIFRGGISDK